jgi:hypothetical protein
VRTGLDLEEKRRKRVKIYARRVELREKDKKRSREYLAKGVQQGVRPRIKRKLTLSNGVGGDDVLEWSISQDIPAKRLGFEDTRSGSSGSEGLGDEAYTLCLLRYAANLREKRVHMCGAKDKFFGVLIGS